MWRCSREKKMASPLRSKKHSIKRGQCFWGLSLPEEILYLSVEGALHQNLNKYAFFWFRHHGLNQKPQEDLAGPQTGWPGKGVRQMRTAPCHAFEVGGET